MHPCTYPSWASRVLMDLEFSSWTSTNRSAKVSASQWNWSRHVAKPNPDVAESCCRDFRYYSEIFRCQAENFRYLVLHFDHSEIWSRNCRACCRVADVAELPKNSSPHPRSQSVGQDSHTSTSTSIRWSCTPPGFLKKFWKFWATSATRQHDWYFLSFLKTLCEIIDHSESFT